MASKRNVRRRKCGRKQRYSSELEARNASWHLFWKRGMDRLQPYRCRFCHHFHLGHGLKVRA